MAVVSDTSPISNLAIIGHLQLLREQLGSIFIPPEVHHELGRHPNAEALARVNSAIVDGWIQVSALTSPLIQPVDTELHIGEIETLTLALQLKASLALLDDSHARAKASQLGIPVTGVLGILRRARLTRRISSLKEEIKRLRSEARFFVSPPLEKALLISVGEM